MRIVFSSMIFVFTIYSPLAASQDISLLIGPNDDLIAEQRLLMDFIEVDSKGSLYIGGSDGSVIKVLPDGTKSKFITTSPEGRYIVVGDSAAPAQDKSGNTITLIRLVDMTIDTNGNVYVVGMTSNNVVKISSEGAISEVINLSGDGIGNLLESPRAVTVTPSGDIYVVGGSSNNLFKISSNGDITMLLEREGLGGSLFSTPVDVIYDSQSNIYVSSAWAIFRITPEGIVSELVGSGPNGPISGSGSLSPLKLLVDSSHNIYFYTTKDNGVFRANVEGEISKIIDVTGDGSGELICTFQFDSMTCEGFGNYLSSTSGINIDSNDNVYVTGSGSKNVFKITPSGEISEIFDINAIAGFDVDRMNSNVVDTDGNYYFLSWRDKSVFKISSLIDGVQSTPHVPLIERNALITLYNSASGGEWNSNQGWDSNSDSVGTECMWYGVTCENGSVTKINLSGNGLTGIVPSELENLSNLSELDLSNNQLTGIIPHSLINNLTLNLFVDGNTNLSWWEGWPSPYSGVTPDPILGLAPNNIGIYNPENQLIYACVNIVTNGLQSSHNGMQQIDLSFEIISLPDGLIKVNASREFNKVHSLNENAEQPDCSGEFETSTNTYTDFIEADLITYAVRFELVDSINLVLSALEIVELQP